MCIFVVCVLCKHRARGAQAQTNNLLCEVLHKQKGNVIWDPLAWDLAERLEGRDR